MDVVMPQLGETVREGTVLSWKKQIGEKVSVDEPLFEVETDKVTMEVPAPANGILSEILVGEGTQVKVGTRLAVVTESGAVAQTAPRTVAGSGGIADGNGSARLASVGGPANRRITALPVVRGAKLSPVVRRLLWENQLSADAIRGTGRDGRIKRSDVLSFLESGGSRGEKGDRRDAAVTASVPLRAAAVEVGADDYVVALSRVRKATGAHMVRSKATSPHTLQAVEVDFHGVERARRQFGADWKGSEGFGLTYLPFIARAVCDAIKAFPYINSSFGNDELIVHKRIHLGIAVDVNFEGLMVGVVRDAQYRNLRGIGAEIHRLSTLIRASRASSEDVSGGTYTISNSGSFGTLFSAAIINQPQAAILSTDGVRKRAVVVEGADGDSIAIRPVGILAQSFDHRAFDGAYSAAFLRHLREFIEQRDWSAELS